MNPGGKAKGLKEFPGCEDLKTPWDKHRTHQFSINETQLAIQNAEHRESQANLVHLNYTHSSNPIILNCQEPHRSMVNMDLEFVPLKSR